MTTMPASSKPVSFIMRRQLTLWHLFLETDDRRTAARLKRQMTEAWREVMRRVQKQS